MRKDIIIAVTIGFIFGALTAILAVSLPSIIKKPPMEEIARTVLTPMPTQIIKAPLNLVIEQPMNEAIVSSKSIHVSGKTEASATVVLETDSEIEAKESSQDGSFSFPVNLSEGGNTILITAYNEKGQSERKTAIVFYTGEKL